MNNLQYYREALHQIPETSFTEFKTQAYLKDTLIHMGYEPQAIIDTGLYVYINNEKDETIAFRTDIDALPVTEETGVAFESTHPGYMHACGHDGHMAMLLGLAEYLKDRKSSLQKNVLLLFQPAEESIGGAKRIVETGIFDRYNVQAVFGIHLYPDLPEGTLGCKPNEFMAMANEVDITVHGKGAHGAMPHLGIDANLILSKLLLDFQTIQTRFLSPLDYTIITFGKMGGGSVRNAISDIAFMEGTIRSFDERIQQKIVESITAFTREYETLYNCTIDVNIKDGYLPVINNVDLFNRWKTALNEYDIHEFDKPLMIAEDFSFYQKAVPGLFYFVGTKNEPLGYVHSLHHPQFNFHPKVLSIGLDTYKKVLREMGVINE